MGGRTQGLEGNQVDVDLPVISQLKALLQSGQADTTTGEFYYTYRVIDPRGAPLDGQTSIGQRELEALHAAGYDPQVERFSLDQVFARSGLRSGEEAIYRVRGNPSMQSIKQLSVGLRNRAENRVYSGRGLARRAPPRRGAQRPRAGRVRPTQHQAGRLCHSRW